MFPEIQDRSTDHTVISSDIDGKKFKVESEVVKPLLKGDDIHRYEGVETDIGVIYPYEMVEGEHTLIEEDRLKDEYPLLMDYLYEYEDRLRDRGTGNMRYNSWYALYRSREKHVFESRKLITPDICNSPEFSFDSGGTYLPDTGYSMVFESEDDQLLKATLAVLNSSTAWFFVYHTSPVLRGGYRRFKTAYLEPLPIPDLDKGVSGQEQEGGPAKDTLSDLSNQMLDLYDQLTALNTTLRDHLGSYSNGQTLADVGLTQPPEGSADSILQQTTEEKPNLRVGEASVERESANTVEIRLTARYKPDDEDANGTDQWGYTETEPLPSLRITDLAETEADLIEAFVPVAVDEAGGFADFRETATKTNSLVDRLRNLTLPAIDDVRAGLESYIETVERAEELEAKIERTDDLIDEIVYELYGLTDEEIEIVEETVAD